jgi:hypothetical protein
MSLGVMPKRRRKTSRDLAGVRAIGHLKQHERPNEVSAALVEFI